MSVLELQAYFHDVWTSAGWEEKFYKHDRQSPLTLTALHLSLVQHTNNLSPQFIQQHAFLRGRGGGSCLILC